MNIDMAMVVGLIKKLLVIIFQKYEVDKELEAVGVDIIGILGGEKSILPEG